MSDPGPQKTEDIYSDNGYKDVSNQHQYDFQGHSLLPKGSLKSDFPGQFSIAKGQFHCPKPSILV